MDTMTTFLGNFAYVKNMKEDAWSFSKKNSTSHESLINHQTAVWGTDPLSQEGLTPAL